MPIHVKQKQFIETKQLYSQKSQNVINQTLKFEKPQNPKPLSR